MIFFSDMNEFFENDGVDSLSAMVLNNESFDAQAAPDIPGVASEVRFTANYDPQGELNNRAFDALEIGRAHV